MIDIHAHIIPEVDDGAEDPYDALLMAEMAVECGVSTMIATPHSNLRGFYRNEYDEEFRRHVKEFRALLKERKIPLTLLYGMEIFVTRDVGEKIREGRLIPLNGSEYYLVEFDFDRRFVWMTDRIRELTEQGIHLIIAHPERYMAIQREPARIMDWLDLGCQLQINKGSLFGRFGEEAFWTSEQLLENDCVTYVASDAHNPYRRTPYLGDAYDYLRTEYSERIARLLLRENQERYLLVK